MSTVYSTSFLVSEACAWLLTAQVYYWQICDLDSIRNSCDVCDSAFRALWEFFLMTYCRSIWGSFCIIWNCEEKNINFTVIISLLRTACRLSLRLLGIFNSLCNADLTPPSPQCIYWESILRKLQTTPPSPPPYWLAPETWETKGHILCQCSWFARVRVHFDCVPLWRGGACLPQHMWHRLRLFSDPLWVQTSPPSLWVLLLEM